MAWSKTCKIATFIGISASAVILLVVIINVTTRLCENKHELFHREDNKCYLKASSHPCKGEGLVFQEEENNSQYGQCGCPHTDHARSMLFHRETNRCYYIFTQGFCDVHSWVNVSRSGVPFCEPNRCLGMFTEITNIPDEVVPLKGGKCGVLNHYAEGCKQNETLKFYPNHILPRCDKPIPKKMDFGSVGVPPSKCPLGSYPSIMGKCQPDFDFDK